MGFATRLGFSLREDLGLQVRYSLYRQEISLPPQLTNCNNLSPDFINTFPTPNAVAGFAGNAQYQANLAAGGQTDCFADGEASLAAKTELAGGPVFTSLVGYTLSHNTLDSNKNPTSGLLATFSQDFAGVGGDVNFIRTTAEFATYREVVSDVVGVFRLQGGYITGWGDRGLRMLDHFQMGPNLVRGFAPAGIGPRDLTQFPFTGVYGDALGGTHVLGRDAGVSDAGLLPAQGCGHQDRGFRRCRLAVELRRSDRRSPPPAKCFRARSAPFRHVRSTTPCMCGRPSASACCGSLPFGPLRFDYSFPLTSQPYDRIQRFRFGGGTKF